MYECATLNPKSMLYPEEHTTIDMVGEELFLERAIKEFGERMCKGTALTNRDKDMNILFAESAFRNIIKGYKYCVEIGTFRGMSTAILAHYCRRVYTIDVCPYSEAILLWQFFGVRGKIQYCIVEDNNDKKNYIDGIEKFDFAFIDGEHTYDSVKYDFGLVKKCGNVLFHDYGNNYCGEVQRFIDELPKEELTIIEPFALWKQQK